MPLSPADWSFITKAVKHYRIHLVRSWATDKRAKPGVLAQLRHIENHARDQAQR
jgi:hypothetical protein